MDIIDIISSKTFVTDLFGELHFDTSVVELDYPRLFIASSDSNDHFAFLENDFSDDSFGWNVSKVNLDDINDVNLGLKNVQSLFINKPIYLAKYNIESKTIRINKVDAFVGDCSIEGSLFVKPFCDMDELFDYHGVHVTSVQKNESIISLIFEKAVEAKTWMIFKAIKYIIDCCKQLDKPLNVLNSSLETAKGSIVISFKFPNENSDTVFDETKIIDRNAEGVKAFGDLLASTNPNEMVIDANKNDVKAIVKYQGLINTLDSGTDSRPKILVVTPKSERAVAFHFDSSSAKTKRKIVNEAKRIYKSELITSSEDLEATGILTGIYTKNANSFAFSDTTNGQGYNGTVDFSLLSNDSSFIVNGAKYKATIRKTVTKKSNETIVDTSYKLLKLEMISKFDSKAKQLDLF